jgi:hypothetical protein
MRIALAIVVVMLCGCQTLVPQRDEPQPQRVNPYQLVDFPEPRVVETLCVNGQVRSILSGTEATVISFFQDGKVGNMRFPLSAQLNITFPNAQTFCYEYFDIGG